MLFDNFTDTKQKSKLKLQIALSTFAILFSYLPQNCNAKEVVLTLFGDGKSFYDDGPGSEVANNEKQISLIEFGDTIIFKWKVHKPGFWQNTFSRLGTPEINERRVRVGKFLGEGGLTKVYDILGSDNNQVLRIAKNWHTFLTEDGMPVPMGLEAARKGFALLQENHIPTVKVFDHENMLFTIVEKIEGPSLEKFLLESGKFSQTQLEKMLADFLIFARNSARMSQFGDLKADALIYHHEKGWTFIDSHPSTYALSGPIEGFGVGCKAALCGAFENDGHVARVGLYDMDITIPIKDASGSMNSYRVITGEGKAKIRKWILYVRDQMNDVVLSERKHIWFNLPREEIPAIADFVKELGTKEASPSISCSSIF